MNASRLFTASCISLIATAMSFAIRGDIMPELQQVYGLNDTQLGWIGTAAFWGFGLSILFGGPLCDLLGMGTIMRLAAIGHIGGTLLTIFAPNFTVLFIATVIIGTANGFVEAAINPLVATIYSTQKTAKLTALHAWFPGGIVIGGLLAFAFSNLGLGWQAKMLLLLVPSVDLLCDVRGPAVPGDRARRRRHSGVGHGQRALHAALPRRLGVHVADGVDGAGTGHLDSDDLQSSDSHGRAGGHRQPGVDQPADVPAAAVRRRHLTQGLAGGADCRDLVAGGARVVSLQPGAYRHGRIRRRDDLRHRGRVLVADDARDHLGALPAERCVGARGDRGDGQLRDRNLRSDHGA